MSRCSRQDIYSLTDEYLQAGFNGFVLVNHFNTDSIGNLFSDKSWAEIAKITTGTFEKLRKYAEGKLQVAFAVEIAFEGVYNDYLVYGLTEELLSELVKFSGEAGILKLGLPKLYEFTSANKLLLVQAHPFRKNMLIVNPDLVDGYEVFNGCTRHNSSNDIALKWAEKYGKIMTSGSDHHWPNDIKNAGVLTNTPITSQADVVNILKSGNYKLITE